MQKRIPKPKKTVLNIIRLPFLIVLGILKTGTLIIGKLLVTFLEVTEKVLSIVVLAIFMSIDYCIDSVGIVIGGDMYRWLKQDNSKEK